MSAFVATPHCLAQTTYKARERHVQNHDNDRLIVATISTAVKIDDAPEGVQQNETQRQKRCKHKNIIITITTFVTTNRNT